jgi:fatty-acyl-CoA synthase
MSTDEAPAPAAPGGLLPKLRLGLIVLGVALSALGVVATAAGPLLYRTGALDLNAATVGIEGLSFNLFLGGVAAAGLALGLSLLTGKQRGVIVATLCVIASGYGVGRLYGQAEIRRNMPPIWDVQTDWTQPVALSEALTAERAKAGAVAVADSEIIGADQGAWSGKTFAAAQAEAYDLKPLIATKNVAETTAAATQAIKDIGWKVERSDPATGVVEATETTAWYGLTSDVLVRVRPDPKGARIDVRSVSRAAGHDMGANASRASTLLEQLNFALRGSTEGD